MIIPGKKVEAIFEKRLNRFVARVDLKGGSIEVHVPNSGRLAELLVPGARVVLRETANRLRKYCYDLIMVYKDDILVSVDSMLPNKLMVVALKESKDFFQQDNYNWLCKTIKKIEGYDFVRSEVKFKDSRFDIGIGKNDADGKKDSIKYYMEVKGVTLVEKKMALFPDAPTERGTKHLLELVEAKREGFGAGVCFVIQREDADAFSPNDAMDTSFGRALRAAARAGVDVFAVRCRVELDNIELMEAVKIIL
ncbi:MAG: sugar fermentation stimulation protein [Tepidanaerobacteraceae bacterium]|nr:sugar fermentation stimulation protein [Tepidanaerobacteraceae bacterium]